MLSIRKKTIVCSESWETEWKKETYIIKLNDEQTSYTEVDEQTSYYGITFNLSFITGRKHVECDECRCLMDI